MQISDDIFLGPVAAPGPLATAPGNPAPMELGVGPVGRILTYDIVPLTLQAAGLATSQNPGSGAAFNLAAGTGVTARLRADGTTEYVLDVPRCVTITAAGANTATYRVEGYDVYGQFMTANLAAPSTSTVQTTKAFKTVTRVVNINATAGTNGLTVGFNDRLGLPVVVPDVGYIISVKWSATLAQDAGTFVAADATNPATAATGDVRGLYTPSSASNGSRRLLVHIALSGAAAGPQATRNGAYGVAQA